MVEHPSCRCIVKDEGERGRPIAFSVLDSGASCWESTGAGRLQASCTSAAIEASIGAHHM